MTQAKVTMVVNAEVVTAAEIAMANVLNHCDLRSRWNITEIKMLMARLHETGFKVERI